MAGRRRREESLYGRDAAKLAAAIRSGRESAGLTQEQLAHASGLSLSTVRKIESSAIVEPGFFPIMILLTILDIEPVSLRLPTVLRLASAWVRTSGG